MTSRRNPVFFILFLLIYLLVSLPGIKASAQESDIAEITAISVKEVDSNTEIQIDSSSELSYTIYKPADPYRVVVELQGVVLGEFKDKIVVDRAGVMEIIPSETEGSVRGSKLEIVLTVPAEIKPVQKDKSLILTFYNPETEEIASADEPVLMADATAMRDAEVLEKIELSKSNGKVNVLLRGDGKLFVEVLTPEPNKLIIDIPGVTTSAEPPGTYEPPVLGIRVGQQADKTRVVIDLAGSTEHEISKDGNQVVLSFEKPSQTADIAASSTGSRESGYGPKVKAFAVPKTYVGEKISIDFQDADLLHIFRLIADVSGYNIVVSPQVSGKFSMKLTNVPWDQALDIILRNYNLSKSIEDNIIRIAPTSVLAQEEEQIARAKEAQEKAGTLITKIYPINYADVDDIKDAIENAKILTNRGFISVDDRTSSIIIKDVEDKHPEFIDVINTLDAATLQVSIEAKIVEVSTNFTHELGIQWGVLWKPTAQTTVGALTNNPGTFTGTPLIVDFPAPVGTGTGASLGFGYIGASALRALDIQLSAMESSGKGKIISNPRIITLDNQKASIQQGKKIPYQTVSAEGTQTQFVDANLELSVTPHITPEGTIVLDVRTTNNEALFDQSVNGVPAISTKEAETQVLIKDGDTLVMGGIFKTNETKNLASVPYLSKIPILGWLFKKEKIGPNNTTELLIFITPRIIK